MAVLLQYAWSPISSAQLLHCPKLGNARGPEALVVVQLERV
ncbi:hypothetical protein [Paenibacillus sp. OSY-SE]|nr:hypothetical protein [Paenibacillus sp. OSY-SE]